MKFDYREIIPKDFDDSSRVWVYQSSRIFSIGETFQIEAMLNQFISQWNSHGLPVKGYANLFFRQFIVFMADETATGVSGCSTDSSVRLLKQIEQQFDVNMFDRLMLAFIINDKIQLLPLSQVEYAAENNIINTETLCFNNLVYTKKELLEKWIIPVKESWLKSRLNILQK